MHATGAVCVFENRASGWRLRRVVKPNYPGGVDTLNGFAFDIALGDHGRALLVGESTEDTEASKPGNPQGGHHGTDSGAFWIW